MRKNNKSSQCTEWLEKYLAGKTLPCEEVREAAFAKGFTRRELQIARVELGVVSGAITTWSLPEDGA